MNRAKTEWIAITGSLVLVSAGWASIPERYQTIVDRNPFGLNPPVITDAVVEPKTPPAKVSLTGFAKISGEKRAYFVVHPKDNKEQPQYLSLSENQREGILEVLKISEEDGEVKVKNSGQEMTLSLKSNNMNPPPKLAPGVTAVPTVQPPPPVPNQPGAAAVPSTVYDPSKSTTVVPGYNKTPPPQPGVPPQPTQPAANQATPAATAPPTGLRTIPTRTLRLPSTTPNPP